MAPNETAAPDGGDEQSGPEDRPAGRVDDRPVLRRIGERDLFLGDSLAANPSCHDGSFDFVLSATEEARPLTTHHHPLIDGAGTDWSAFEEAVDTARDLYRMDATVLIHCSAGISRGSTLVGTTIAAEEDRQLREALGIVREARPIATPHPALYEMAVTYLAARS